MIDIRFHVPGLPIAQPRQQHRIIATGGRTFAQNYTPAKHPVNQFKAAVQAAGQAAYHGPLLEVAVLMTILVIFPRPKSMIWKTRPMPRAWAPKKPDFDNLGKSVADSLNNVIYRDDSQVVDGNVVKLYAAGNEQPHAEVVIIEATEIALLLRLALPH